MTVMTGPRWQRASSHLDRVLDLPPAERDTCLAALRQEQPETAADVEALLEEHRLLNAEGFLDARAMLPPDAMLAGVTIGAYTLVSPIGHGGMGSVWLASRSDGRFEGQAALKLLNTALVGRGGEERFRREGTILARLTHPHIARLIDAGVSGTGQPYLVLEHIEGRHIDRFCDEEQLDVEARVRLFLDVQAAVAHAHANLIVHRDLKPSNVLVTADGGVKLLDFGIAKLLEDEDTGVAATALTREAGPALTPKYAAPEQVTGGPITTATDVYSLGVLLFELLSGVHPTGTSARSAAEFYRAVAEQEPLRLSAAPFAAAADARGGVAARRGTTAERLPRLLRGDLETILAKALKRDPAERYSSVAEFADDLRRFIGHEPIAARRDTVRYRAAKFVRRHWRILAASASAAAVLVALIAFYTVQLARGRDQARLEAAKAAQVSELLTQLLTGADPYRNPDAKEPTVQNLLEIGAEQIARDLGAQPEVQTELLTLIGRTYQRMGQVDKALPVLERAVDIGRRRLGPDHLRLAHALNELGAAYREQSDLARGEAILRESLAMRRRLLAPTDKDIAVTLVELSSVLQDRGADQDAEPLAREALAIRRQIFGDEHRETATSKNELGLLLWRRGAFAEAEQLFRENLETSSRILGPRHAHVGSAKNNLALVLRDLGQLAEAEALLRQAHANDLRVFGEDNVEAVNSLHNLATTLELQGRTAEAQAAYEEVLRVMRPRVTPDNWRLLHYEVSLARVRLKRGEGKALEAGLRTVLRAREQIYQAGHWRIGEAQSLLAASLFAQARYADAEPLMIAADRVLAPGRGAQSRERDANRARLASLYLTTARPQQAARYR